MMTGTMEDYLKFQSGRHRGLRRKWLSCYFVVKDCRFGGCSVIAAAMFARALLGRAFCWILRCGSGSLGHLHEFG